MNPTPSFIDSCRLIFRRSLTQARRAPVFALGFPILFPVFMIGLFSQLYRQITAVPGFPASSYVTWMAPAVVLMAAMFGAGYSATGLITDTKTGYLERLRLLPIHPSAILVGRLAFDVARVLAAGAVVLAASVALGADFHPEPATVVLLAAVLAVWTLGYTGLFYFVGLKSGSAEKLAVLIPLFLPISLLSTAYIPKALAPRWVQDVSTVNPYTHVVDAARQLMAGQIHTGTLAAAFGAGLALIALTQLGAARFFARAVRTD